MKLPQDGRDVLTSNKTCCSIYSAWRCRSRLPEMPNSIAASYSSQDANKWMHEPLSLRLRPIALVWQIGAAVYPGNIKAEYCIMAGCQIACTWLNEMIRYFSVLANSAMFQPCFHSSYKPVWRPNIGYHWNHMPRWQQLTQHSKHYSCVVSPVWIIVV